jgi:hypothetical protein
MDIRVSVADKGLRGILRVERLEFLQVSMLGPTRNRLGVNQNGKNTPTPRQSLYEWQAKELEDTELGRVYGEWKVGEIETGQPEKLRRRGVLIAATLGKEYHWSTCCVN